MTHVLKTWPEYFEQVITGQKNFEVRKNDRVFSQGDILVLEEWNNVTGNYTGRKIARLVSYVLQGGQFGIEEGFVVMAIK